MNFYVPKDQVSVCLDDDSNFINFKTEHPPRCVPINECLTSGFYYLMQEDKGEAKKNHELDIILIKCLVSVSE